MRIEKVNMYYVIILFMCILDLNCFYLVDTETVYIAGLSYLNIEFLIHIMVFAWFLMSYFMNNAVIRIKKVGMYMIFPIALSVISAYAGTRIYGQSFLGGLVASREWIGYIMMFFPISYWMKQGNITLEGLKKLLLGISIVYLCICSLQYVLSNVVIFTYVTSMERYGEARYLFYTGYLMLMLGFSIDKIMDDKPSKQKKYVDYILLLGTLVMVLVISKARTQTIALCVAICICMLIRKTGSKKKLIVIAGIIIGGLIIMVSPIGSDILNTVLGKSVENDTLSVRAAGKVYYLAILLQDWLTAIIGCGNPNYHSAEAMSISNPTWIQYGGAKFYLTDQGIVGYLFIFGLVGLVWYLICMGYCIKRAYLIYKKKGNVGYLFFCLIELFVCMILIPSLFRTSLVMILYMVQLEEEVKRMHIISDTAVNS